MTAVVPTKNPPGEASQSVGGGGAGNATKTCLIILTFLAVSQALYAATAVMLPIAAALVAALGFRPIVRWMARFNIPAMVAAALVFGTALATVAAIGSQLVGPATEWAERAPIEFHLLRLQRKLQPIQGPLEDLSSASEDLADMTSPSSLPSDVDAIQQVVVKPPSLINEVLSSSSQFAAGTLLFLVLTYFFLGKGEVLVTRIVAVFGTTDDALAHGDAALAVERSVSTYLLTVSMINGGLGIAVGTTCWLVGVPSPMLWGVMAAVLNFLPYIGSLIGATVVLAVSLLSFESTAYAFLAPGIYLGLTAIEGNFVTPAILGRSMSLNPLVVILSLTYWTWLWGLGGAILAVPLLAIATSMFRQFESTRGLALMLSD